MATKTKKTMVVTTLTKGGVAILNGKKPKRGRPKNSGGGQAPALSPEQVKALLWNIQQGDNAVRNLALVTMLLCGLRVSEPLTLRRRDVLNSKGQVNETFVLGRENTKSSQARRCYINETARKALGAWLAAMGNKDAEAPIFELAPNYATRLVGRLLHVAGIPGSSHSLRRTAAMTMADNGVGVHVIKELLGHANLSTTAVYVAASTSNVAKAVTNNLAW
jgi:integrase/recombinase XerD